MRFKEWERGGGGGEKIIQNMQKIYFTPLKKIAPYYSIAHTSKKIIF